jgi:hypothetical protein
MPHRSIRKLVATDWFDRFARFGYTAKGVVFGTLGLLMLRVGLGSISEQADFYGAFEEIGEQPLNFLLLGLLAVGLFSYSGWRVAEGVLDVEGEGSDVKGWVKRSLYIVIGLSYGLLAVWALGILAGWSTDDDGIRDLTVMAMKWPFGEVLVGGIALLVMVSGVVEVYAAVTRRFEIEFGRAEVEVGRVQRWVIEGTGFFGHLARGIVYGAAGFFALRAAVTFDPDEARGLADTIREIATQPFGFAVVFGMGAGFVAFGVYCVLLALHRHIPNEGIVEGRGDGAEAELERRRAERERGEGPGEREAEPDAGGRKARRSDPGREDEHG